MIKSFRHAGLERFFTTGSKKGIQPAHAKRLSVLLTALDEARSLETMDQPGYELHGLKGDRRGIYSVKVNANWRLTFRWNEGDTEIVGLEDYH